MTEEQILEWLDKNNRGFTQKDFELFKKFYEESTKELQELYKKADENWWNAQQTIKELTLKVSGLESDCDAYNYSQRTYQEEIKELKAENEQIKNSDTLCKLIGEQKRKITDLEAQIEKMKCCGNCAKYNSGYGETPCKISASAICGEWETSIGKF